MPNNTPVTLAELEECRDSIVKCIGEVQKISDYATNELATLKAALVHIKELIKDFKPDDLTNKRSSSPRRKNPAA